VAKTPRPGTDTGIGIGQTFLGKYRVEEILGQGGMGIVARCTHLALNEQVAVKMLRSDVLTDDDAVQRFMREAQAAVKLRSEYVARVSDVGTFENGVPYMVMEFLDGQDLGVLIDQQGHVAVQWAVDLMLQTCEALSEAHSINIVHRDIKPSNLFVTWRPDGTSLIKVLDFGISKSPMGTDMQLTQTQSLLGTPAYMSPEQMRSARLVDQRTDIWSLGTVMYELLEGHRPFDAESFSEMCVKVAVDAPLPMVHTPPALQQVVLRCLAKSPEQRYANMAELGRELVPFARDPHAAQNMVERMFRLVGRASGNSGNAWDPANSGRAASPAFRSVATPPGGIPVADSGTMRDHSTPAILPLDITPRKRRTGLVIGLVVAACVAAAAVALVIKNRSEPAATAKPTAKAPTPAVQPPPPPPTATVDPPKQPEQIVAPPPIDEAPSKTAATVQKTKPKQKPKATGAKKPPSPPVEVRVEPTPPSTPPPVKKPEDLYSKPRPDK
jgi:serine/threonine-protein kinase